MVEDTTAHTVPTAAYKAPATAQIEAVTAHKTVEEDPHPNLAAEEILQMAHCRNQVVTQKIEEKKQQKIDEIKNRKNSGSSDKDSKLFVTFSQMMKV